MIIEISLSREDKSIINMGGGQGPSYLVENIGVRPEIGARVVRILKASGGSGGWKEWSDKDGSGVMNLKTNCIETVAIEELMKRGFREILRRHSERYPKEKFYG